MKIRRPSCVAGVVLMISFLTGCDLEVPPKPPSSLAFGTIFPALPETLSGGAELTFPSSIAVDDDGIWIADTGNDRVVRLDHDLTGSRTIGREGEGPGELKAPLHVTTTRGELVVGDLANGRVTRFSKNSQYLSATAYPGDSRPLAAMRSGAVLAAGASESEPILKWSGNQWVRFTAPLPVSEPGRRFPPEYRISVTADGAVWLLDGSDGGLWRFDHEGRLLNTGQLPEPLLGRLIKYRDQKHERLTRAGFSVANGPITKGLTAAGENGVLIHLPLDAPLGVVARIAGGKLLFDEVRITEGLLDSKLVLGSTAVQIWRNRLYLLSHAGVFVLEP